jgi:hypothetical protein
MSLRVGVVGFAATDSRERDEELGRKHEIEKREGGRGGRRSRKWKGGLWFILFGRFMSYYDILSSTSWFVSPLGGIPAGFGRSCPKEVMERSRIEGRNTSLKGTRMDGWVDV